MLTLLAGWDVSALSGTTASPFIAQTADIGLVAKPGLTRDSGVTAGSLTKGFSSSGFPINGGPVNGSATTADLYFDVTVAQNFTLSLSNLDLNYRCSGSGPKNAELDYSLNGGTTYIPVSIAIGGAGFTTDSAGHSIPSVDLSTISDLQGIGAGTSVRLRIVPYGGTGAAGTFAVFDLAGNDLALQGTSVGLPGTPTVGGVSANPNPVGVLGQTNLIATNVSVVGGSGTITSVEFYRESNNIPGLQIGDDTDAGAGILNGASYTLFTTAGVAGTYTYYAVASDSNGNSSAPASTPLTVSSNPSITFASATYLANEADGTATITVSLSAPAIADTTVDYATSDGTHFGDAANPNIDGAAIAGRDYTPASGTVHFAVNDTSKTFTIPLLNVKTFEGIRYVNLTLSNPNSAGILGGASTARLAITDNAITSSQGTDFLTSTPTSTYELTLTSAIAQNGFMALSPTATNGFGSGANIGPDMPYLEFADPSTLFPTTYAASTIDSIKLSLFNTATTGTFGGHAGSFDLYLLSNVQGDPLSYRYTSDGATGIAAIGTQGGPLLVGSGAFTNNVIGFNDFIFDNLSPEVRNALKASLNGKTPVRFVITPSAGSAVAADWEGNSTFNSGLQKPQLTLIAEKSAAIIENFTLSAASATVNKNGTVTITLTRSGSDLTDAGDIHYATANGSALAGTDYATTTGTLHFNANDTQASFTIPIADTGVSPDKYFTVSISSPTVSGAGHLASLVSPTTQTITIHDARTTNISQQAGDVATVQPAGPRAAPNGKNFFNIEGSGAGPNASFGVADFNTGGYNYTLPDGETIGSINSISLGTINAPAGFTHSGALNVYLVDDATADINNGTSSLIYNSADPIEGLYGQLGGKHVLGSLTFDAAQSTTTFTDVLLTGADPAALNLLKNDINTGAVFRIVIAPEDATVAATWAGTSFGTIDGTGSTYEAPRLSINYTKGGSDNVPPTITASSFQYALHPSTFTLKFSEDVYGSLAGSPITVKNLTTGESVDYAASYDAVSNVETLTFAAALPDGNYHLEVPTSVTDAAGNPMAAKYTSDFFVLKGDVDRNRSVGFSDLVTVAQHYGQSGQTYDSGDLDGNGSVGFSDLVAIAQNYGKTLAAPPGAAATPAPLSAAKVVVKTPTTPAKPAPVSVPKPVAKPIATTFSTSRVSAAPKKRNDLFI